MKGNLTRSSPKRSRRNVRKTVCTKKLTTELLNVTVWLMANVISTTIVMLTRLLDMRIVARSCSDLFTNEYAREHLGSSSSSRRSSMSAGVRPKYAISLPLTKAESIRQTQAITISTDHAAQLIESGAWNSIAR